MSWQTLQGRASKGTPGLVMGTAPGTESYNDNKGLVGSQRGGTGGGFPFGSMQPTRVIDQTLGMRTNHTINYAHIVRRFKRGFDKSLNVGQYVFIEKGQKPIGERMYTLLNLPMMNFVLLVWYKQQVADQVGGGEDRPKDDMETKLNQLDLIVNKYTPHGVINNEVGAEFEPQERLLNCTVSGRCRVFNVFGDPTAVTDGTPLYFVLHRYVDGNSQDLAKAGSPAFTLSTESHITKRCTEALEGFWTITPYASRTNPNPIGPTGVVNADKVHHVWYVGRVARSTRAMPTTSTMLADARRDIAKQVRLPMIEAFLDYGMGT